MSVNFYSFIIEGYMHSSTERLLDWYANDFLGNVEKKEGTPENISRALFFASSTPVKTLAEAMLDIYMQYNRDFRKFKSTVVYYEQGAINPFRREIRRGINACNTILSNVPYYEEQYRLKPFQRDPQARNILQRAKFGANNEGLRGKFAHFIHSFN